MNHQIIGSEELTIHLEKSCTRCIKSLENKMGTFEAEIQEEPKDPGREINIIPDPLPDPNYNFAPTEKILSILPELAEQTFMSEEWKKNRRIKLFNDRHFHAKYLIKKKENGSYDYEAMIQHIHFLEECIKDLKTEQQAFMLAKTWHIENENIEARERIKEEDKKYKIKEPATKETKSAKPKMTTDEKKIAGLIALGIAEDKAREIILGKK
jgi:hypothetical protein